MRKALIAAGAVVALGLGAGTSFAAASTMRSDDVADMHASMQASDMEEMHQQMRDAMPEDVRVACDAAHAEMTASGSMAAGSGSATASGADGQHAGHHDG